MFRELARDIQTKQLHDWADRYGAPVARKTIDLAEVFTWLRRFIADNARKLATGDDEAARPARANSPALEEYRRWKAQAAKLDVQERERNLLAREDMHLMLGRVAAILRQAGATLQRQFGADAGGILNEALDDAERDIRGFFRDRDHQEESDS